MRYISILLLTHLVSSALAFPTYRVWEPPSVNGEKLRFGSISGNYYYGFNSSGSYRVNISTNELLSIGLPSGAWTFAVEASSSSGSISGVAQVFTTGGFKPYVWSEGSGFQSLEQVQPANYFTSYETYGTTDSGYTCAVYRDDSGFDGGTAVWHGSQLVGNAYGFDAYSINNDGTTVGWDQGHYGYYQRIGQAPVRLPWFSTGGESSAIDINNLGFITGNGFAGTLASNVKRAVVWAPDGSMYRWVDSVDPAGYVEINDSQEVVYNTYRRGSSGAFVHTGWYWDLNSQAAPARLDSLLDASGTQLGYQIGQTYQIDNSGNILAQATLPGGSSRFVVLEPVPEPGSLAFLALGAVGLMRRRRN